MLEEESDVSETRLLFDPVQQSSYQGDPFGLVDCDK
jgi:hypothetical protein